MSKKKRYCEEPVWESNWPRSHPCGKTAKHFENGKWYCGIHCEEAKKRRMEKSEAKYNQWEADRKAEREAAAETQRRADLFDQLVEALPNPKELRSLAEYLVGKLDDDGSALLQLHYWADIAEDALKAAKGGSHDSL